MNQWVIFAIGLLATNISLADSWPTYRHDTRRSAVTDENVAFPLRQQWVRFSKQPPQTAWTGPAKWDAYSGNSGLQSMRNFDPCFFVTVADGRVYFGSSVDDAAHCLNAETGVEQWLHFTGAAVRFPPTIDSGRVYFGSDDGLVYCCDASSGELVWKRRAAPENKRITSNRKLISMWPVRTGVLVHDGMACFAGSLVPWQASYLWKVDAVTGQSDSARSFRTEMSGITLQGALLASADRIYAPQGRAAPLAFDSHSGKSLGVIGEAGGVFCVLTEDEILLAGPQNQRSSSNEIRVADGNTTRRLASFRGSSRILVSGRYAWIPTVGKLKMLDRKSYVDAEIRIAAAKQIINDEKLNDSVAKATAQKNREAAVKKRSSAWLWEIACPSPSGFIKTASAIVLGLDDEVRAYSPDDGSLLWQAKVDGRAQGLAVADGQMFVSTGLGHIYAFGPQR